MIELLLLGFWILCGVFAATVAQSKGHGGCAWFIGGFLFGPLALLAAAGIGDNRARPAAAATGDEGARRPCPACAEMIKVEAVKCRFCGADVEPLPPPAPRTTNDDDVPSDPKGSQPLGIVLGAAAILAAIFGWASLQSANAPTASPADTARADQVCTAGLAAAIAVRPELSSYRSSRTAQPYGEGVSGAGRARCYYVDETGAVMTIAFDNVCANTITSGCVTNGEARPPGGEVVDLRPRTGGLNPQPSN